MAKERGYVEIRYTYLSPHQYESMQPYVDTLVGVCWSGQSLDVAAPHDGARCIGRMILSHVLDRFRGRMATIEVGLNPESMDGLLPLSTRLKNLYGHNLRFGLLITDRLLPEHQPLYRLTATGAEEWLCVDWYQWFYERVEARRQADLWSYLCYASPDYADSPERTLTGIEDAVAAGMAEEGRKLLQFYTEWLADVILELWQDATIA